MKHSILKKLTLTNALILFASLLIFCSIAISVYNQSMYKNMRKQLIVENKAASIIARVGQNDNLLYKALSDSRSLVYEKKAENKELELVYTSDEEFDLQIGIDELIDKFIESKQKIIELPIGGSDYLCAVTIMQFGKDNTKGVVISLVSVESIKETMKTSIIIMLGAFVLLLAISTSISVFMSRKIAKPLVRITELTKSYAKRDFSDKYIADTNDEIKELSLAVSQMAESLQSQDKDRDKMFRQISHEIKTPLTAIYGYAEGLKTGIFKSVDEPVDAIMRESLRIKKLTENIIYLSKLESNAEKFVFDKHDVGELVESAIESVESLAILKDIDIVYMPRQIDDLRMDAEKMHRALINILSNCIKYTKDKITIEVIDENNVVEFRIYDNGKGFGDEDISDLLSGLTRVKSNGSGIGLSIVNEIVKAHDGNFIVGNKAHGGAEFRIAIRRDK